jgi:hypothetical protein
MVTKQPHTNAPAPGGRAVDDEDPDRSPMVCKTMPTGPAQPFDVDEVEKDRARSQAPRLDQTGH